MQFSRLLRLALIRNVGEDDVLVRAGALHGEDDLAAAGQAEVVKASLIDSAVDLCAQQDLCVGSTAGNGDRGARGERGPQRLHDAGNRLAANVDAGDVDGQSAGAWGWRRGQ